VSDAAQAVRCIKPSQAITTEEFGFVLALR
jgi:hypothetical protein